MDPKTTKVYPKVAKAIWPFRLPNDLSANAIAETHQQARHLADAAQYGWGHTIDFGPFSMEGILQDNYLQIAGLLDEWQWWPNSLRNLTVADIGCFTGGLALVMASRGAEKVAAWQQLSNLLALLFFSGEG